MASRAHKELNECPSGTTIPLIDFSPFLSPTSGGPSPSHTNTANQLVSALHTTGFVYITNHGIPPDLLDQAFAHSKRFFRLSHAEKMLAPHPPGSEGVHRGYSSPGLEKVSQRISRGSDDDEESVEKVRAVRDAKESFEIGSEDFAEQPNLWPPQTLLPGWREFMLDFYWTCHRLAMEVLRAVAIGLDLKAAEAERFLTVHSGLNDQLRLLHYPSIPAWEIESGGAERMPAHSDWSCITMLFQDDCGGLEVEDARAPGRFVPATPVGGAVVVNVGDLLMRWSNDYLRSTMHRVALPPLVDRFEGTERLTRERWSIPFFVAPDPNALVECLPTCVSTGNTTKYEPVTQREYGRMRAKAHYQ